MGTFEEGKEFDALLVDVNAEGGPFDIFDGDTIEDQVGVFRRGGGVGAGVEWEPGRAQAAGALSS